MQAEPRQVSGTVLIVDDDAPTRALYAAFLNGDGLEVVTASSADEARRLIAQDPSIDVVVLDVMMPDEDGLMLLSSLRAFVPDTPVIMVTASESVSNAVVALKNGAFDYLAKPITQAALLLPLRRALERAHMRRELLALRALSPVGPQGDRELVISSAAMRAVVAVLEQVKDKSVSVMLLGESGVGKEVAARFLHRRSKRAGGPFVAVNCAMLTRELAPSELFGHEKGAFTGATAARVGRFEEAERGTLFLDEVGELDLGVQASLLRALQDREVMRVGGGRVAVDVRVVVATHRDLRKEVQAGRFREDLFHRLDVIALEIPPLRERTDEIPLLAAHLLERFVVAEGLSPLELSEEALAVLASRDWPGNVRELDNVLKRSALLAGGPLIGAEDLILDGGRAAVEAMGRRISLGPSQRAATPAPGKVVNVSGAIAAVRPLREYEPELMLRALAESHGNVSEAARRLGIGRATFYRWAKRHDLAL